MKKKKPGESLILLLFLFLLMFSCSDNIGPHESFENLIFKISVPEKFYSESSINSDFPKIVLTDDEGELIIEKNMGNDTIIECLSEYDTDNNEFDLNMLTLNSFGGSNLLKIQTFKDVDPYQLEFVANINENVNNDKATINIENGGSGIIENFGVDSYYLNEDLHEFKMYLNMIPDNFYVQFKNVNEDFRRYFWKTNVNGETNDTIGLSDTQVIQNSVNIIYPNNEGITASIDGIYSENLDRLHNIGWFNSQSNQLENEFYPPDNLFQYYRVGYELRIGKKKFLKTEISNSIQQSQTLPEMELEIESVDVNDISLIASGVHEFYSISYSFVSSSNDFELNWQVYGKSKSDINLILPNLLCEITKFDSDFTLNDLEFGRGNLYKFEEFSSYKEFMLYNLSPKSLEENYFSEERLTVVEN